MRVELPNRKYNDGARVIQFYRQATEKLAAMPGVESVGAVSFLPFAGLGAATGFAIVGRPAPPVGEEPVTDVRVTPAEYFKAMRVPVIRGRIFNAEEAVEERHVAVIDKTLARKYFPDKTR